MKSLTALVCSMGLLVVSLAAGVGARALAAQDTGSVGATQDPAQIVQSVAQSFLKDLDANRTVYSKNPQRLREAVDRDVLPYFDVQYAARLVLARYWRTATPQQREQFVSAFENSLFANYGNALLGFQSSRLQVLPSRLAAGATNAIVRTTIRRDDGSTVSVNFALHQTPQGWKAWDVIVEGISYVKSFRDDFGAQIEQQGIDAVIQRLQRGEKPPAIANPGGAKTS
ncbi:MAG TPA: ABC transporter substrate-binding protein [Steroidobacteraceae bacterium]|nr:ABC transporter substrate-binding protein [Steroidobacteraceae bacterium]